MDTPNSYWVVMCQVSGGVTGTRTAELVRNEVIVRFPTEAAAEAEVARLRGLERKYAVATFSYWTEERSDWYRPRFEKCF